MTIVSTTTAATKPKRMNWQRNVIPKVQEFLGLSSYRPTMRGTFYRLVSDNIITNIFKNYKGLIQALSLAREKSPDEEGYISVYAFADNTRFIEDIDDEFWSPEEFVDYHINILQNAGTYYLKNGYLTRWHNQLNYVEVMIEKNALRGAFKDILSEINVPIVPNNGWSSKIYTQKNIDRLVAHKRGNAGNGEGPKEVYVLYFGDYDPTGLRMSDNIERDFEKHGINFERVGLNKQHISEYSLDHLRNPDPEVMKKLKKDANREIFKAQNNGELFQIELDALQKSEQQFKSLILDAVNKYYDKSIYQENLRKFTADSINIINPPVTLYQLSEYR